MLLWILGPVLGPLFRGYPSRWGAGIGVFPLVYKGFLHYTLPGEGPYWVGALDHAPGDDALDHASTHHGAADDASTRHEVMHHPVHDQLMHDPCSNGCMQ